MASIPGLSQMYISLVIQNTILGPAVSASPENFLEIQNFRHYIRSFKLKSGNLTRSPGNTTHGKCADSLQVHPHPRAPFWELALWGLEVRKRTVKEISVFPAFRQTSSPTHIKCQDIRYFPRSQYCALPHSNLEGNSGAPVDELSDKLRGSAVNPRARWVSVKPGLIAFLFTFSLDKQRIWVSWAVHLTPSASAK